MTGKRDRCLAHHRSFGDRECLALELQRPPWLGERTFAGAAGNDEIAPNPDFMGTLSKRKGSTLN